MCELNISSYIQIIQSGLKEHSTQETAGKFLFSAINDQQYVADHGFWTSNLGSKKISRVVHKGDPVPDGLREASQIQCVIDETIVYFRDKVMPDLNPHLKDDTIDKFVKLIDEDKTISDKKKDSLLSFYETGDEARFLAEAFLYALNRPNKEPHDVFELQDAQLLAEANYKCPICNKNLVDSVKGQAVKKYKIIQIFPDDLDDELKTEFNAINPAPKKLDSLDNLIALDINCAESYLLSPTVKEYEKLHKMKNQLQKNFAAKSEVNNLQIEENIRVVIEALSQVRDYSGLVELNYDALRLSEKFTPENFILQTDTQVHVVKFYHYVEKVFSDLGSEFNMIAAEIKMSSMKLEQAGLSQSDVITHLSEWIMNKSGLGTESRPACNIIVSFFIQNCEVFSK